MAYSAEKNSSGTYDILQDGNKVSTGSAAVLGTYGLSEENLGGTAASAPKPVGYNANAALQVPASPIPTPTPASYVAPPSSVNLPQPTAPQAQAQYQTSVATTVDQAKTALDTTQSTAHDQALQRINDLTDRLGTIQSESDPTKRATYAQEQSILQNQLDAAQTASATLKQDFENRRSIVGELTTLLTDGNNYIEQLRGVGGVSFVRNARVQDATQLIQARAGVLQATLSGLDGNVALAHSIIDNASAAVKANWNDIVTYNNAVLKLATDKELAIDTEDRKYAEQQVTKAQSNLTAIQSTVDTLKNAMIDPVKAKAYAQAGVTLLDSPEQIAKKLGDYGYQQEVATNSNDMAQKGYALLMPGQKAPAGSQVVTTTDTKGVKTKYYSKPTSSSSTVFSTTQQNSGASKAGLPIEEFNRLAPDVKNFFINGSMTVTDDAGNAKQVDAGTGIQQMITAVQNGDVALADASDAITSSSLPQPVKDYVTQKLTAAAPAATSGGNWWDGIVNYLHNASPFHN